MVHRVIAFKALDIANTADTQARSVADTEGLNCEYQERGLFVDLAGAQIVAGEIRIGVVGTGSLESIQRHFNCPVRWVSRRELLQVAR